MTETAFIWRNVAPVTDREHDSGGLLVIAQTVEEARARALVALANVSGVIGAEWLTVAPELALPLGGCTVSDQDRVVVFPDAGCC